MKLLAATAAIVLASGSAQATFFSFYSDNNHTDWTFRGLGDKVIDAQDPSDPIDLIIDDDNGPAPQKAFQTEFDAEFDILYLGSVPMPMPGKFLHAYAISGKFSFTEIGTGNVLLTAVLEGGAFTAVGSGGAAAPVTSWDTTAGIQGSDAYGSVTYTWMGSDEPTYGLFQGQSIGLDDAGFDLTVLGTAFGPGVATGPDGLPTQEWTSEGSFSGSAHFIPAPSAAALLAAGGLLGMGRRRTGSRA